MVTEDTNTTDPPMFVFRVLIEFHSVYNVHLARCLETGSIATADDVTTVTDMIQELLVDQVTFALDNDNLANLYAAPAPYTIWTKFRDARRPGTPSKPIHTTIQARNEVVPAVIQITSTA